MKVLAQVDGLASDLAPLNTVQPDVNRNSRLGALVNSVIAVHSVITFSFSLGSRGQRRGCGRKIVRSSSGAPCDEHFQGSVCSPSLALSYCHRLHVDYLTWHQTHAICAHSPHSNFDRGLSVCLLMPSTRQCCVIIVVVVPSALLFNCQ